MSSRASQSSARAAAAWMVLGCATRGRLESAGLEGSLGDWLAGLLLLLHRAWGDAPLGGEEEEGRCVLEGGSCGRKSRNRAGYREAHFED